MKTPNYTNIEPILAVKSIDTNIDVPIHLHDTYEIYKAESDNIRYHIEGFTYHLSKNDFIITNNRELHRPQVIDHKAYLRKYIQFDPRVFNQVFTDDFNPISIFTTRPLGHNNALSHNTPLSPKISRILDHVIELANHMTPRNRALMHSATIELLVLLHDAYKEHTTNTRPAMTLPPKIQAILIYLNNNYCHSINLDSLSHQFFIDKFYMASLFKKNTGFTIIEYLQSKRIQYAKTLILEDLPMTEVSLQAGFDDYSNFFKTFKKLVNCPPSTYKKRFMP